MIACHVLEVATEMYSTGKKKVGRHGIFGRGILSLQIKNEVGSGVGGLVKHKIIMTNERKETV